MRYGAMIEGSTVAEITANVDAHRRTGYSSAWLTDGYGYDPLTVLAVVGQAVPDIELGTAVVRTYPRHPLALAQQALTVNDVIGHRLALGIGPSHRPVIESTWGMSFDRPIRHVREYLSVLGPMLQHGTVDYSGQVLAAHATLHIDAGLPCPVLVGALGPQMLEVAGALADGTITFMVGPQTLATLTCPTLRDAADRAGKAPPRIVAMMPLMVTDDEAGARQRAAEVLAPMTTLPSYRAAVEREGTVPILAGAEEEIQARIAALEDAGVTDLILTRVARRSSDEHARTLQLVDRLCATSG